MKSIYQFEILQKSGTTNCIDKAADSIDEAWRYAEKQADPGIVTVRVRNPVSIGHGWHSLDKARKLEHIARFRRAAKAEANFLRSLIPATEVLPQ